LATGATIGGLPLRHEGGLDREEALRLWTSGSAWFTGEEDLKGILRTGAYADLAVLSEDCFTVPAERIPHIESVLTVVDGAIVHGAGPFVNLVSERVVEPPHSPLRTTLHRCESPLGSWAWQPSAWHVAIPTWQYGIGYRQHDPA
jgi:hypothetical protein